jgi:tetratricopeptide (TPR) repeat protein
VEEYTLSLGLRPNDAGVHNNRAAAYLKLRRWRDVVEDAGHALQLEPGNAKALLRRGRALEELGQLAAALQVPCAHGGMHGLWGPCVLPIMT